MYAKPIPPRHAFANSTIDLAPQMTVEVKLVKEPIDAT